MQTVREELQNQLAAFRQEIEEAIAAGNWDLVNLLEHAAPIFEIELAVKFLDFRAEVISRLDMTSPEAVRWLLSLATAADREAVAA